MELAPTLGTWPAQALSLELWNLELGAHDPPLSSLWELGAWNSGIRRPWNLPSWEPLRPAILELGISELEKDVYDSFALFHSAHCFEWLRNICIGSSQGCSQLGKFPSSKFQVPHSKAGDQREKTWTW